MVSKITSCNADQICAPMTSADRTGAITSAIMGSHTGVCMRKAVV